MWLLLYFIPWTYWGLSLGDSLINKGLLQRGEEEPGVFLQGEKNGYQSVRLLKKRMNERKTSQVNEFSFSIYGKLQELTFLWYVFNCLRSSILFFSLPNPLRVRSWGCLQWLMASRLQHPLLTEIADDILHPHTYGLSCDQLWPTVVNIPWSFRVFSTGKKRLVYQQTLLMILLRSVIFVYYSPDSVFTHQFFFFKGLKIYILFCFLASQFLTVLPYLFYHSFFLLAEYFWM